MVSEQRAEWHAADYWKLPRLTGSTQSGALKVHIDKPGGRHHTSSTTRTRLLVLVKRTSRGLRCYDGDPPADLLRFIQQRGISSTSPNIKSKQELITLLEAADEEATFVRFLDLPPELRLYIYELHFTSYTTTPRAIESATPPPITQVNTQLRKETLSLFYNTCEFQIAFSSNLKDCTLVIEQATADLITTLPRKHLAAVRNMRIRINWDARARAYGSCLKYGEWEVCLPLDRRGEVTINRRGAEGGDKDYQRANTEIHVDICTFVKKECVAIPTKRLPSFLANFMFFLNCRIGSIT